MPIYISKVMADDLYDNIAISSKRNGVEREGNVLGKQDTLIIKADAQLSATTVTKDNLMFYLPSQWMLFGSGPCVQSNINSGYFTCSKEYTLSPYFTAGQYVNELVALYRYPLTNTTPPNNWFVKQRPFTFYVDDMPPMFSIGTIVAPNNYLMFSNGKLSIPFNANDQAFSGANGMQCAGIKEVNIYIIEQGVTSLTTPRLIQVQKDLSSINSGCNLITSIPPNNSSVTFPKSDIVNIFGTEFKGNVKICGNAKDKLDLATTSDACDETVYTLDLKAPELMEPAEKIITDSTGTIITSTDYIKDGEVLAIIANFTKEQSNPPSAILNASYFSKTQQSVNGVVTVVSDVQNKWTATWNITTSNTGIKTNPVTVKISDIAGNVLDTTLFAINELPKALPDNTAPTLVRVNSSVVGWVKQDNNKLDFYINDTPNDLTKEGSSGFNNNNVRISSANGDISGNCIDNSAGLYKCTFNGVNISGGSDGQLFSFDVTSDSKDDAGNTFSKTSHLGCDDTNNNCKIKIDINVPTIEQDSVLLTNKDSLGIGSGMDVEAIAQDSTAGSGILYNKTSGGYGWNVYLNGPSECELSASGVQATECAYVDETNTKVKCTWTNAGATSSNCFGKDVYVNFVDNAGNNQSKELKVETTKTSTIDEIKTKNGNWIKDKDNVFFATISAVKLTPIGNYNGDKIKLKVGITSIPANALIYVFPSTSNGKYNLMFYREGTVSKPVGFSASELGISDSTGENVNIELSVQDDFAVTPITLPKTFSVDITYPKVTKIEVVNKDPSLIDPIRFQAVDVIIYIDESSATGFGIDETNTFLPLKAIMNSRGLNEISSPSISMCSDCGCKSTENNKWVCQWEFGAYNPWTTQITECENGSSMYGTFSINVTDKAGNMIKSTVHNNVANVPEGCGVLKYKDSGTSQSGTHWTATVTPQISSINRNFLKSSSISSATGGLYIRNTLTLTKKSGVSSDLKIALADIINCTSPQYPDVLELGVDNSNFYINGDRTQKYFVVQLPTLKDDFLKKSTNDEIKVTCTVAIKNTDKNYVYNDYEYVSATINFDLTSKFNRFREDRTSPMSEDIKKEIENAKKWSDELYPIVNFGLDGCKYYAYSLEIVSIAAAGLGWVPGFGSTVTSAFATMWGYWQIKSPWDVTSVKYWCSAFTCDSGGTWASGFSALADGTMDDLTKAATAQDETSDGIKWSSYMDSNMDPRTNIWLAWFQLPPCVTGLYNYYQMKKVVKTTTEACNKEKTIMGNSNSIMCNQYEQQFECVYSGGGNVIARYMVNIVLNYVKSYAMKWALELIGDLGMTWQICPTGGLAWEPQCYAYAAATTGLYIGKIQETKKLVEQHKAMDSTSPDLGGNNNNQNVDCTTNPDECYDTCDDYGNNC